MSATSVSTPLAKVTIDVYLPHTYKNWNLCSHLFKLQLYKFQPVPTLPLISEHTTVKK